MATRKFSAEGIPTWFSPQHASEKFKIVAEDLQGLLDSRSVLSRTARSQIKAVIAHAREYQELYGSRCPIRSVRVMEPSGAVFVTLSDGREILVPQG